MKTLPTIFTLFTLLACQDDALPTLTTGDDALKTQLRGVWLPTQLQIKYQVGLIPGQRDGASVLRVARPPTRGAP